MKKVDLCGGACSCGVGDAFAVGVVSGGRLLFELLVNAVSDGSDEC